NVSSSRSSTSRSSRSASATSTSLLDSVCGIVTRSGPAATPRRPRSDRPGRLHQAPVRLNRVGLAEHRRPGHEQPGARLGAGRSGVHLDPAVYLDGYVLGDELANAPDL